MTDVGKCPNCGGNNQYQTETAANGGYGPMLLHGLGGFIFNNPKMRVVVCGGCGYMRMFAGKAAVDQLDSSPRWKPTS